MKKYFLILFAFIIFFIGGADVFAYDFAHWKGATVTNFDFRVVDEQWYRRSSNEPFIWLYRPDFPELNDTLINIYQFGGSLYVGNQTLKKGTATIQLALGYDDIFTGSSVCKWFNDFTSKSLEYSSNGDNWTHFDLSSFNCTPQDQFVIVGYNITISSDVSFNRVSFGIINETSIKNRIDTLFTAINIISSEDGTQAIINQNQTIIDQNNSQIQQNDTIINQNNEAEKTRKGILETIKDLPNSFMNMLKGLFIPEDGYFEDWFNDLKTFFEEKLGFLATPFTIFIDFINMYLDLDSSTDIIIDIPDITVPNFEEHKIVSATTFNWSELLKSKESLNALWQLYLSFIDVYLILNFIGLCESKYNRIFGGDTSNYEYYTVEDSVSYDGQTGEVISRRQNERRTTRKKVN